MSFSMNKENVNTQCWKYDHESIQLSVGCICSPAEVKIIFLQSACPNQQCNCYCCYSRYESTP